MQSGPESSTDPGSGNGDDRENGLARANAQRLEPRVRLVWLAQVAGLAVVLATLTLAAALTVDPVPLWAPAAVGGLVAIVGGLLVVFRYRRWRFELREDALYLERGVITRVRTVVPYVRIQHVDASRGPLERATGLARSVVYTAGSRGADVTIPGLTPERADDLQERLKGLAVATGGDDGV